MPLPRRRRSSRRTIPLDKLLRRRAWQHPVYAVVAVVLLVLLVVADRQGLLLHRSGDDVYHDKLFDVVRVVDGDTLIIAPLGAAEPTTRVRLWGIDTPEKFRRDPLDASRRLPPDPFAEEASALARDLCDGVIVRIYTEPHRLYDKYDRLLAYVELPDGSLLNERLILSGLAKADNRWNHTHLDRFALLQAQAQRQRVGMWADDGRD